MALDWDEVIDNVSLKETAISHRAQGGEIENPSSNLVRTSWWA